MKSNYKKLGGYIRTVDERNSDLAITNLVLGDYMMGLLSIARTFPNNITSIINTISPIFTPVFINFYAKGEIKKLNEKVIDSIETTYSMGARYRLFQFCRKVCR